MLLLAKARTCHPKEGGNCSGPTVPLVGLGKNTVSPQGPSSASTGIWEHKQGTAPLFPYMQEHLSTWLQSLNTTRKNLCLRGITYCLGRRLRGMLHPSHSFPDDAENKQTNKQKTWVIAPGLGGLMGLALTW